MLNLLLFKKSYLQVLIDFHKFKVVANIKFVNTELLDLIINIDLLLEPLLHFYLLLALAMEPSLPLLQALVDVFHQVRIRPYFLTCLSFLAIC